MGKLYNQLEIIKALRVSPTTVKRWIQYFHEFIPTVRQGDMVMYESGTLKLLRRVRTLRNNRFSLKTILNLLEEEGFEKFAPKHSDPISEPPALPFPEVTSNPVKPSRRSGAFSATKMKHDPEAWLLMMQSLETISREFAQIASQIDKLINED